MSTSWAVVTPPTLAVMTVAEAKLHARIVQSAEDSLITSYIAAGTQAAEDAMNVGLLTQKWRLVRDWFAYEMYLPRAYPLQNDPAAQGGSTVPVITYYDANGTLQTLDASYYTVDTNTRPAKITLAPGKTWPTLQSLRRSSRVIIDYTVGYTAAASVPERIKQGIRMYVAYLACDREGMEMDADKALKSAKSCWTDVVEWIETCGVW